ncbi:MFS transporter [Mucilaginibacter sp.]|jgi:ACS family hexuronate transporter-like MFS transporter|uniref:MFS transporter n=1 Tax=Mucilaginibacter sp. TaxID=1882438 RepID=UPI002B5510DF|nr:MFS transporter [Mucilaginibacter sp.]HTI60284.1 MFS transporter [Mucilaginibacter sp.]
MNEKSGNYRWVICALIFFATTINYLDRAVISLLKSDLTKDFHWNDGDYANIEIAFKVAYSIGLLFAGRLIDRLGTKMGYFFSTLLWSFSAVFHALANSTFGFGVVRFALGLSEAGNFPAAIKTVAEWFPKKDRALATGIFNTGAGVGAIVAPLTVPFIAVAWGWRWAFIITGSIGFIWLIFWLWLYEIPARQKRVSKIELDYIHSDADEKDKIAEPGERISWAKLLSYKQTWAFSIGKFLTDPIWWFYLFWLPDFLESQYGLKMTGVAMPVALVYLMATVGSIYGGYLPKSLIEKSWPVFKARKTSMLIYAFAVVPIVFAQILGGINMWLAVIIIGLAASAHQAWSANIFTTVSDMFPKRAVGSVTGIGGMFGSVGSVFLSLFVQKNMFVHYRAIHHIEIAYYIMFFVCGASYLLAWCIMHFLVPKMKGVDL